MHRESEVDGDSTCPLDDTPSSSTMSDREELRLVVLRN